MAGADEGEESILGPKGHGNCGGRQGTPRRGLAGRFAFLARDAVIYGVAGALNRVTKIVLTPILATLFPAAVYGAFDALGVYVYVMAVAGILGLNSAVVIIATLDGRAATPESLRGPASTAFRIVLVASSLVAAAILLAPELWSRVLLGSRAYGGAVTWAAASVPVSAVLIFGLSLLQWSYRRRAYIVISAVTALLTVGLTWAAATRTTLGLEGFLMAGLAGQAVGAVAALVATRDLVGGGWDGSILGRLLQVGMPFAVIAVAGTMLPSIDRIFLVQRHSLDAAGIYGLGQKVASLTALALAGFQAAWGPFAFAHRHDRARAPLFRAVFVAACLAAALLALLLTALAPLVVRLIAADAYRDAAIFVGPLALSAGLGAVFVVVAIGSVMEGRSLHNLAAYTGGIGITLAANVLLAVAGAPPLAIAWANVLGQAAAVVLMATLSQRVHPLPYAFAHGAAILVAAALLIPALTALVRSGTPAAMAAATGGTLLLGAATGWWALGHRGRAALRAWRPGATP